MREIDSIKAGALAQEAAQRLAQGDQDAAKALAERALELDPGQPAAREVLDAVRSVHVPWYSVIIPTCDRLDILRECLRCLERQTMSRDAFEVLVVDDASGDGTVEFLKEYHPPFAFRPIFQARRGGPARARNAGIRAARGEVVHFLNDDALIEPQVLQIHSTLHNALSDRAVSVLGRFDFAPPFTESLWGYALEHSDLLFRYPTFEHNGLHGHRAYYSCNISTPRRALIQAGLFDEAIEGRLWGAEDMELGRRLEALPVPVLFRDDSRSVHVHDVGVKGLARTASVRGGGAVWMFAKHGERPHYAQIGAQDVAYWRSLPARLMQRMEQLHTVLAEAETLRPVPDAGAVPYLRREDFADMHERCLALWPMRTRDLLEVIAQVEGIAEKALQAARAGESMQRCAVLLYPAMLFIRFFHDTIGVCASDAIRRFCPQAPPHGEAEEGLPGLAARQAPAAPACSSTAAAAAGKTGQAERAGTTGTGDALPSGREDGIPGVDRGAGGSAESGEHGGAGAGPEMACVSAGKRVLLVCNFFWPSVGGTELFIEKLGLQLQRAGHHVEIACRWLPDRSTDRRHGMRIHSFHCHGKFFDPHMGPDIEKYRSLVRNGGFDAVITLAHPDNWTCHALRDLPQPRPRIIMMPSINSENIEHWEGLGVMSVIAGTLQAADICVAVSENGYDVRTFDSLGVPHVFIPHAVEPDPVPWSMRERLSVPADTALLACVGNFWPVKNQLELLRRFAAEPCVRKHGGADGTTCGDGGRWHLVLAGGALPWEAEARYFEACWDVCRHDPRMRILGPLPPQESAALIRDADALLVPSRGESAGPLVVLEAMSMGVPWVATPQCNAVHDEAGGVITGLDDFPRAVRALLAQPALAGELGRNGREHWERCFRWEVVAPIFDALLHEKPVAGGAMPQTLRVQREALARRLLGSVCSVGPDRPV